MTLMRRLVLAQGPLALALLLVGIISQMVVTRLGQAGSRILADNYRSIIAAEQMKATLVAMDHGLVRTFNADAGERARLNQEGALLQAQFESPLEIQLKNITEPHEDEATRNLVAAWQDYLPLARSLTGGSTAREGQVRLMTYLASALPKFEAVDRALDRLIALNQDAMVRKSDNARRSASRTEDGLLWSGFLLALAGLAASVWLTRRVLRPLNVVTSAVRRFGQGDLAARANVRGRDEIAALATEFNTMANHLLRYRQSSLGELLLAERATQATLDALPDAVVVLDNAGQARRLNVVAGEVLHVDLEKQPVSLRELPAPLGPVLERVNAHVLQGRGAYIPKDFEEAVHIDIEVAGAGDRDTRLEARLETKRETATGERVFLPRGAPIYGESGDVAGVAIVLQDVTRLFHFDELKNNLVATVAHDLRTPLLSLRLSLHLCVEEEVGPLTPRQTDLMSAAREDCEKLQTIVDDLLNLSHLEAGRPAFQRASRPGNTPVPG